VEPNVKFGVGLVGGCEVELFVVEDVFVVKLFGVEPNVKLGVGLTWVILLWVGLVNVGVEDICEDGVVVELFEVEPNVKFGVEIL